MDWGHWARVIGTAYVLAPFVLLAIWVIIVELRIKNDKRKKDQA